MCIRDSVTTVAGVASNVTTVAGVSANVTTVAGVAANVTTVAGIASDVTAVANDATDIGAVAAKATEIGRLGTADAVADLNTLGTTAIVSDLDTCATSISNINNVGGSISNVNTVASNMSTVNDFAARYRVASSDPSSNNDEGDLCFNTTSNELRVYNGSAWQGGVTATGNLAGLGANQFSGNITFTGSQTVDGRDLSVDGAKLDGIEANATADQTAAEIRTLVDNAGDSNVFTDADHTKLNAIEANATADQTAAEIRALVESASDSNVFTDADHTKLNGIEANATADQTKADIEGLNITSVGTLSSLDVDGIVTFLGASNSISWIKSTNSLNFTDNALLKFGTSSDLIISHNGTDNRLDSYGKNLDLINKNTDGSVYEKMISCIPNGAVEIYENGTKRFETTSSGCSITGGLTVSGDLQINGTTTTVNSSTMTVTDKNIEIAKGAANDAAADGAGITVDSGDGDKTWNWVDATDAWTSSEHIHLGDNKKLLVGTGSDLEIYHNTSSSYLSNSTGNLALESDGYIWLGSKTGTETYIKGIKDGACELYFNNTKRIETTSSGANIVGALTVNGTALSSSPTYEATATGAITAGKPVIVHTDGTLKQVAMEFTASTLAIQHDDYFGSQRPHRTRTLWNAANNRAMIYWTSQDWGSYPHYATALVNDSGVTTGSPSGFDDHNTTSFDMCWNSSRERGVYITARTSYGQSGCHVGAFRQSGSTQTKGTTIELDTGACNSVSIAHHSGDRYICAWKEPGSDRNVKVRLVDMSSSNNWLTLTAVGSEITAAQDTDVALETVMSPADDNGKHLLFYSKQPSNRNNGYNYQVLALSVSGTTITAGTAQGLESNLSNSGEVEYQSDTRLQVAHDTENDKFLVVFERQFSWSPNTYWNKAYARNISIGSGTTLNNSSASTEISSDNPGGNTYKHALTVAYEPNVKGYYVFWSINHDNAHNIKYAPVTCTGTNSPTVGSTVTINTINDVSTKYPISDLSAVYGSGKIILSGTQQTSSSGYEGRCASFKFGSTNTNLTSENYIGLAKTTVANGATATVDVVGSVNSSQSSLTAGQNYYVQNDGTLGLSAAAPAIFAGTATTSSKILVGGALSAGIPVKIASGTISSSTSEAIIGTDLFSSAYDFYTLKWWLVGSNTEPALQVYSGDAWQTSSYESQECWHWGGNVTANNYGNVAGFSMGRNSDGANRNIIQGEVQMFNMHNTSYRKMMAAHTYFAIGSAFGQDKPYSESIGGWNGGNGAITGLRWKCLQGNNFTDGKWILYGYN